MLCPTMEGDAFIFLPQDTQIVQIVSFTHWLGPLIFQVTEHHQAFFFMIWQENISIWISNIQTYVKKEGKKMKTLNNIMKIEEKIKGRNVCSTNVFAMLNSRRLLNLLLLDCIAQVDWNYQLSSVYLHYKKLFLLVHQIILFLTKVFIN